MVYVRNVLMCLIWGSVTTIKAFPDQPNQTTSQLLLDHPVDRAQLARNTVRFCYSPNGHAEICKYYIFASTFSNTWQETRDYCLSLGDLSGIPMDLVAIESREENELIGNHILTNYATLPWWTAGTDEKVPDLYVWASTGYGFTYYDWDASQPNDPGNNTQTGVILLHVNGKVQWHDAESTLSFYALCEQK